MPIGNMAEGVRAIAQRALDEKAAAREAAAEPLPGPLRDVFAPVQNITVGPYSVRPFDDGDFEILSQLDHPLYQMMKAGIDGRKDETNFIPQGPAAWELCCLMTTPAEAVDALIAKDGIPALKAAARAKFRRLTLVQLAEITKAIVAQMSVYWSPVVQHGEPAREGEQSSNPSMH